MSGLPYLDDYLNASAMGIEVIHWRLLSEYDLEQLEVGSFIVVEVDSGDIAVGIARQNSRYALLNRKTGQKIATSSANLVLMQVGAWLLQPDRPTEEQAQ